MLEEFNSLGPISFEQDQQEEWIYGFPKEYSLTFIHGVDCVGTVYPTALQEWLEDVKPGTILSFLNGDSLLCRKNSPGVFSFEVITPDSFKTPTITQKKSGYVMNIGKSSHLQWFYQKFRNPITNNISFETASADTAYSWLYIMESSLKNGMQKNVSLGPLQLIVKKQQGLTFWEHNGSIVQKEDLLPTLHFLLSNPVCLRFIRKPGMISDDTGILLEIEQVINNFDYASFYQTLKACSKEENANYNVRMDFYLRGSEKVMAGSFLFKEGDAYKVSYHNNDFSTKTCKASLLSEKEFYNYCNKKYQNFHLFQTSLEDSLGDWWNKIPSIG